MNADASTQLHCTVQLSDSEVTSQVLSGIRVGDGVQVNLDATTSLVKRKHKESASTDATAAGQRPIFKLKQAVKRSEESAAEVKNCESPQT